MLIIEKKFFFIFGEGPTDVLDDPTLTAEAEYSINFSKQQGKFNLNYNGSNSLLFVNGVKMYQFKAKDSRVIYSW